MLGYVYDFSEVIVETEGLKNFNSQTLALRNLTNERTDNSHQN